VSAREQKRAEALEVVRGMMKRGLLEWLPGTEHLPEMKRPFRPTSKAHLQRVLELQPTPDVWLRQQAATGRLAVERDEPLVVCLPDDDRPWREPR
jgi:hypothetical protein